MPVDVYEVWQVTSRRLRKTSDARSSRGLARKLSDVGEHSEAMTAALVPVEKYFASARALELSICASGGAHRIAGSAPAVYAAPNSRGGVSLSSACGVPRCTSACCLRSSSASIAPAPAAIAAPVSVVEYIAPALQHCVGDGEDHLPLSPQDMLQHTFYLFSS